jgi:hypothetical protein
MDFRYFRETTMPTSDADFAISKAEVLHLRHDVDRLLKIVIEGNGHSMTSKIAVMENKMEDYRKIFDKMDSHALAMKMALFAAGLSFASSIAVIIINFVLKK